MGMDVPKDKTWRRVPAIGGSSSLTPQFHQHPQSSGLDHALPGWSDALVFHFPFSGPVQEEIDMSPKQRRKFRGSRRTNRRPRDWTRWFREGVLETEARGSLRLRTILTSLRAS